MKILMISSTFPYPPSRGGTEVRTFNLLKHLQQNHEVTLVTQRHSKVTDQEVAQLRNCVQELAIFPLPTQPKMQPGIKGWLDKLGRFSEAMVKATPPNVLYRYAPEIQQWIDTRVAEGKYDAITCEHSVNEIYIRPEFSQSVQTVVNIHSSLYGWVNSHLEMGASPNPLRDRLYLQLLLARYEKRYCRKFSQIVVTTEDDAQQMRQFSPQTPVQVIANGVDLGLFPYRRQDPNGKGLIFVGAMNAEHNIDAARFFALEVLPVLQQSHPEATFTIAGAYPTPEVLELGNRPGVIVTGPVESMVACLHQATVCVVPLRTGYGIKNKTLEAMAAGVPVVASDRGLEGLVVDRPQTPLRALRANQVQEYISGINRLFEEPKLREKLSHNGRSLIEQEYTWESAGSRYEEVLTSDR